MKGKCFLHIGVIIIHIHNTVVVVVYSGVRLGLPIAMHTEIIKRNTQCIYR